MSDNVFIVHIYQQKLEEIRKSYETQVHTAVNIMLGKSKRITGSMLPSNNTENVLFLNHKRMSQSDLTDEKPSFVGNNPSLMEQNIQQQVEPVPRSMKSYNNSLFLKIEEGTYQECEGKQLHT